MNEIEKLYKKCGIKKDWTTVSSGDIGFGDIEDYYPPFTAEKQLELLKICLDKLSGVIGKVKGVDRCILYISPGTEEEEAFVVTDYINFETWEETIAGLVNYFWKDLTKEEKQQIKEILSGIRKEN